MGGRDALSHHNQASSDEPFNPDMGDEVDSYVHLTDTLQSNHLDGGQNVIITNKSPGTAAQKAVLSSDMTITQKPQSLGHLSPTPYATGKPAGFTSFRSGGEHTLNIGQSEPLRE